MLFEITDWMTELHTSARALPKPKSVLVVFAHCASLSPSGGSPAPGT
jgi:4,5-DOPA dioxygenase extradiol